MNPYPTDKNLELVCLTDINTCYAVGGGFYQGGGIIVKTTDGWQTWTEQPTSTISYLRLVTLSKKKLPMNQDFTIFDTA
jgi:hypothetical protein